MDRDELLGFGRHADKAYKDVEAEYLQWMVESGHRKAIKAEMELLNRGIQPKAPKARAPDPKQTGMFGSDPSPAAPRPASRGAAFASSSADEDFFNDLANAGAHTTAGSVSASSATAGSSKPDPIDDIPFAESPPPAPLGSLHGRAPVPELVPGFKHRRVSPGVGDPDYFILVPADPDWRPPHVWGVEKAMEWSSARFNYPAVGDKMKAAFHGTPGRTLDVVIEKLHPLCAGETIPRVTARVTEKLPPNWPYAKTQSYCPAVDALFLADEASTPHPWRREWPALAAPSAEATA